MRYESVLGYSDNSLLTEYREKYFLSLYSDFIKLFRDSLWIQQFQKLEVHKQQKFILHPDNASVIHEFFDSGEPRHRECVENECLKFLAGDFHLMTGYKGEKIGSTQILLSMYDNNPSNTFMGHPDHDMEGGMLGWGEKSPKQWNKVFSDMLVLLKKIDSEFFDEMNGMIQKIVPMKTSIDVHNSCSYKNCIGTLYLGYTINSGQPELNILEALIHESSHNKLNLIMQSKPLQLNDLGLKYYSPYRPDARHIQGVLLGVHAIVPTVYILLKGIKQGDIQDISWYEKVILYHIKNKIGYKVLLKHGNYTDIGKKILRDMADVMQLCDIMIQQNRELQKIDLGMIKNRAKEHFLAVKMNNIHLQY